MTLCRVQSGHRRPQLRPPPRRFFSSWATGDCSGTSGQNQTDAQWIADKLTARGQGTLVIRPSVKRGISLGNPIVNLIRRASGITPELVVAWRPVDSSADRMADPVTLGKRQ